MSRIILHNTHEMKINKLALRTPNNPIQLQNTDALRYYKVGQSKSSSLMSHRKILNFKTPLHQLLQYEKYFYHISLRKYFRWDMKASQGFRIFLLYYWKCGWFNQIIKEGFVSEEKKNIKCHDNIQYL